MPKQIQSLQIFRGLAACAVVAHHAALSTDAFVGKIPFFFKSVFDLGHLGVDFFFVLSGFIIAYAHMGDAHSWLAFKRYLFKRLSRIYPAYLPVGIGLLILYSMMPSFSASGGREFSLLSSLFLIPANNPPALSVAWTLVHELMFYFVFTLFFISHRWLICGLALWTFIIVIANTYMIPMGWLRYPLNFLNIEFILGVCSAWFVRYQTSFNKGKLISLSGIIIVLILLPILSVEDSKYYRLLFAFALALIIIGFAIYERTHVISWPILFLFFGNASYSIYLIHNPLLSFSQRILGQLDLSWPAALSIGVFVSLVIGSFYFLMVEKNALKFFQARARRI